ncbi:uncharacterized protein BXZ73DRAFT_83065 [Epithele typhae]|uniref:uncharacterized protein n=1 Tax=Epithele typhae TaxID=378194 RepID=UPI00200802EB|nr:uncharacterized protein BXZ73DRAFT_83065 [Epithele typhae]KAH9910929.1 hypothetical protein BXZ73DRAFT_83065 [Epithele typhae]
MPAMHPNHREVLEDMIHTRHSKLTLGRIEEALHYGLGAEVVRRDNTIIVRFRAGRCRVLAANDNVESFHAPHDGRGNVSAHHSHLIGRWIVKSFNFEAKRFKHWEWDLMCHPMSVHTVMARGKREGAARLECLTMNKNNAHIFNVIYGVVEPEDIKFKDFEKAMNSLGARKSTGGGSVRSFTAACWKGTVHVHQPHPYDHYTKKNAGRLKVQLESSGLTHRVIRREARKAGIFIPKLPSQ